MIKIIFLFFLVDCILAFNADDCRRVETEHWVCDYMHKHNKTYRSHSEFIYRKNMLKNIPHGTIFGLTSKSDIFPHELRSNSAFAFGHHKNVLRSSLRVHQHKEAVPKMAPLDWRDSGRITDVKDQGACGGCFAFASAAVLEYWEGNHPKSLSAQSIIDCTSGKQRPNVGCDGGLMEYVFEYAKQHPVPLANDFPFEGRQNECPRHSLRSNVLVKDYRVLMIEDNPKAEQQIEHILHNYGPVAVGVDSANMYHYTGGLFKASMCTTDIDHAVTIVGYTDDAWIIKNSWGSFWGDEGYLYLERGKNACGMAEYIVYIKDAYATHKYVNTLWHMSG